MVPAATSILDRLKCKMPFTAAMGVEVLDYQPNEVTLLAPLSQNLNYHNTAFGGSIATLGILAGWMLLNLQLNGDPEDCELAPFHIVIQESRTEYLTPIGMIFARDVPAAGGGCVATLSGNAGAPRPRPDNADIRNNGGRCGRRAGDGHICSRPNKQIVNIRNEAQRRRRHVL